MPKLPPKGALALLAGLAAVLACSASTPPAPRRAPTFIAPTELPNGRVEITIAPSYALGTTITIPVTLVAKRGTVTGPLTARIMASGINEGGAPAEVLVRELTVTRFTVTPGGRQTESLTWDTRDAKGMVVPADAYALVLEVRSDDAGISRTFTAGATLELR